MRISDIVENELFVKGIHFRFHPNTFYFTATEDRWTDPDSG